MEDYQALFDQSFDQIIFNTNNSQQFFQRFYDHFIHSNTQVLEKFANTNMTRQATMLKMSFMTMLEYANTLEETPRLRAIAEVHSRRQVDIKPELYDLWLAALIVTIKEVLPNTDDATLQAWRKMLAPGIDYMKSHY